MKRILPALLVLVGLAPALAFAAAVNPDAINLNMDIAKLGVEQLRLYRNAVYARHCYQFRDGMLRAAFSAYQVKKCGEGFYYEDRPFDEASITPAERRFMARLQAREDELKKGQVSGEGATLKYRPEAVVNRSQFANLSPAAMDRLLKNGFVVAPGNNLQLFHVYEENDYRSAPNFITTDSVLQLYHLYFDFSLREIESEKLLPAAAELCRGMLAKLRARYAAATDPRQKEALRRAVLYFAVAEDLTWTPPPPAASGEERWEENPASGPPEDLAAAALVRPAPDWLSGQDRADFLAQHGLIFKAEATQKGPIMGTVDYTMFKPRGHYTRSHRLMAYFRAMMWLGLPGFILDEKVMPIEAALAVSYELTRSPKLLAKYLLIYEPTGFYVGPTDDITPMLVREAADEICGPVAEFSQWVTRKEEIRAELIKRNPARIRSKFFGDDDRNQPQVRFMGMRYVPDSEILQRLVDVQLRPYPTGLDIFGVMGVKAALTILRSAKNNWPGYWPEQKKLTAELKDLKPATGEPNLYWRWLRLLRTLNQPAPAGAAPFMRTDPWEYKNLSTALGSWAELRHDTILYAKPAAAECGGEEEMSRRMVGYVEARPDFFAELGELQRFTTAELSRRGLLTERLEQVGSRMQETFGFLERIGRKEIEGRKLSAEEYETIRLFGSELERLTIQVLSDRASAWAEVTGPDRSVAVIADVYTYDQETMEEAVGLADEIYALVEIDGYLYITRGAVFSYYEFYQPKTNRLTDEQWQEMLRKNKAPARPRWTKEFMVDQPPGKPSERYEYSSGC